MPELNSIVVDDEPQRQAVFIHLQRAAAQNIPNNVVTPVSWDVIRHISGGITSMAADTTIQEYGLYQINYDVFFDPNGESGTRECWIDVGDGFRYGRELKTLTTTVGASSSGSCTLLLSPGDDVTVQVFSSSATQNVDIGAAGAGTCDLHILKVAEGLRPV